jgi:hypothetical protein
MAEGPQRPVLRVNKPRNTGVRRARERSAAKTYYFQNIKLLTFVDTKLMVRMVATTAVTPEEKTSSKKNDLCIIM